MFECVKGEGPLQKFACKAIRKERVQRHASLHKAKRNIKRVDTEVRALKRFSHAAVVRLVRRHPEPAACVLGVGAGRPRFVRVSWTTTRTAARKTWCGSVMRIAALGLRHCHAQGIAHRDLKPENVLVMGTPLTRAAHEQNVDPRKRGAVKLCDFGLCADVSSGENLTDFVGSPGFFAPELLPRSPTAASARTSGRWAASCSRCSWATRSSRTCGARPTTTCTTTRRFATPSETVLQVKLGSTQCAPSPALRMLVEQLLDLEPARRATVDQLCEAAYFDLVLPNAEGGVRSCCGSPTTRAALLLRHAHA